MCVCPLVKILGFTGQRHEAYSWHILQATHRRVFKCICTHTHTHTHTHMQKKYCKQAQTHTHTHRTHEIHSANTRKNRGFTRTHRRVQLHLSGTHTRKIIHTHLTDHLVLAEVYRGLSDKIINYSLSPLLLSSLLPSLLSSLLASPFPPNINLESRFCYFCLNLHKTTWTTKEGKKIKTSLQF